MAGLSDIYSFQMTDRKSGPVLYITVMYGRIQLLSYACRDSITRWKKGC